jgi:hypothetical protein
MEMRTLLRSSAWIVSGWMAWGGVAIVASAPAHAEGGALYRWETADGTIAFTDDAKRVPERYQESVETLDRGLLTDYGRFTATDSAASDDASRRLDERLDGLRAANQDEAGDELAREEAGPRAFAPVVGERSRPKVTRRQFTRPDGRTRYWRFFEEQTTASGPSLPVDPNDPHPVVTEQQRITVPGRLVTETVTVVRQGDRILSIERPESAEHTTDGWPSLTDLTD